MDQIRPDMTVGQIMAAYPETREVFVNNGFAVFADDAAVKQLGAVLKLKTVLKSRPINAELFRKLLEEKIADNRAYQSLQTTGVESGTGLNMISLLPCPLKIPLERQLKSFLAHLPAENGLTVNYCSEAYSNNHLNFADYLQHFDEPDELPDVIMTAGFNFFYKKFRERFIERGIFAAVMNRPVNPRLAAAGLIDPDGHFTVIAANALVMVVDQTRLGSLPAPRTWGDLLNPEYENKVVIRGQEGYFCDAVQLNFFKDYGEEGIASLARSVKYGLHPAQMVKELSSGPKDGPPIYIMPYFFAKTIKDDRNIAVVLPQDGILVYPVSVLIKAAKMQQLKELAAYLTGPDIARICSDAYFPAVHPAAAADLAAAAKFKWLGWDFIRQHDMENLIEEVNNRFVKAYR